MKPSPRAALYMRLSKDDDGVRESASIAAQRSILSRYAAEHGFTVCGEYADDGYSGTRFDRPAFRRMLTDIEAGRVDVVLLKDLSRLGRDYIAAGRYTELYFPEKGVRCIAVLDGYDSDGPYTDVAPFRNVLNEMYARDISKKIRSALAIRMRDGAFISAFAPYGYQKDPANRNRLVIDERSGAVVRRTFSMAAEGASPTAIARVLNAEGVPPPAVYRRIAREDAAWDAGAVWTGGAIGKLLKNIVYLGHTAQGKTRKASFKSRRTIEKPRDEWIVTEHTHAPLVDEETFALAMRRTAARVCERSGAFHNAFSGIAKCADCGRGMSAVGTRKKGSPAVLTCGGYKQRGSNACSNHFIDYNALCALVRAALREQFPLPARPALRKEVLDGIRKQPKRDAPAPPQRDGAARRLRTLTHIIGRLYEDNAAGRLSDARMHSLLEQYEREAAALQERISAAETPVQIAQAGEAALCGALRRLFDAPLAPRTLFALIDRIEIGQGRYETDPHGRVKRQAVTIYFRFQTDAAVREYTL